MNEEQLIFAKALLEYYAINGIPKNNPRTYDDLYHLHETPTCSKLMLKAVKDDLYSHIRRNTAPPWIACNPEYSYIFTCLRKQITPEYTDPCQTVINFLKEVLTYYEECKRVPFTTEERAGMVRHIYPKSEMLRKPMRSALSKLHRQLNNGKRSGWMFPEMLDQVNRVAAMNFEQNGHLLQISQEEEEVRKAVKRKKKVETSGESDSDYSPPISFWQRERAIEGESKPSTSKNITDTDVEIQNNLEDDNLADTDYTPEEPFVCRNLEENEIKELRRLVAKREDLFQRQFIYHQEKISRMGERLKKKIKKISEIQQRLDKADYIEVDEAYKRKQEQIDVLEAKLQEKERFNTQDQKPLLPLEASDFRQKLAEKEQELEVLRLQLASSIPLEENQKLSDELVQTRDVLQQKEVQLKVLQDQHEASVLEAIKTAQLHEELVTLRQSLESKCLVINPVKQKINDLSISDEFSSLRSSLEAKEVEILEKDRQITELRILVETAHNLEFEKLNKEVQRLKKEIEEDDEELRSNDSEIEDLKVALKKAEEMSAEVPELKENLKKAGENLQQKEQSMRDLELDLIILKDDKIALIENLSKVERNLEKKEKIIKELQSQSQKSYQDGERIQKLSSDLTKNLEELQQKTNTIDVLTIENESLERSSQKLSQDLKKIQEEFTKLAEDLSKSEKLVKSLEESLQGKTDLSKRMEDSTVILTKEFKEKDLRELQQSREELQKLLDEKSSELKKLAKKENLSSDCLTKQLQEKEKELLVKATVIKELKRVNEQLKAAPISSQKEAKEIAQLRKSFGDLQIELEDKNKKLEELKEQKKKDKEAVQKINSQLFQLLKSIEEKTKEIEELSKFRKKAMKETAANLKISEENSKLKEKLEESEAQSKEKERELIKLRKSSKLVEEIPILKRQLKEAKDSNLKATQDLEKANKILENSQKILEEKLAGGMKIIEEKDKSLDKLQSDLAKVRQEAEESSKNLEEKNQNLQNVTKMMEEKDFELADLQEKALKKLEELAILKDQLRLKEKSIESLNQTQNILKNQVQEQETQLRSQVDEISNLKTSLEEKEAEANEQKRLRSNLEIEIQKIRDEILQENHQLKEILKERNAEKAGMNRELITHITKVKQLEMERIHLLQGRSHPLEVENYRRQIFQKDTIINEMKKGLQQMEEALSAAQIVLKESDDKHRKLMENSARDLIQQSQIHMNEKMRLEEELRVTRRLLAVKETQLQGTAGTLDGTSNDQEQFVQAAPMDSSLQMYVQYLQSNQVGAESQVPAFYIMQQDGLAQENVQYVVYPQQGTSTEQATYQVALSDGRIGQIVGNFQLDHRQPEVDQPIPAQTEPITTRVERNPPVEEKLNIKKVVVEEPAVYQDDQQQVFVPQEETELPGTSYDYPGLSHQQDGSVYAPAVFNFPSSHSFIAQAQFQQPTFTQPQAQTQTTFALPQAPFLRNQNAYPSTPTPAMINGVAHHRSRPNSNGTVPVPNYSSLRRAIQGSIQVPRSTEGAMPPPRGSRGPGRPRKHPKKVLAAGK